MAFDWSTLFKCYFLFTLSQSENVGVNVTNPVSQILSLTVKGMSAEGLNPQLESKQHLVVCVYTHLNLHLLKLDI